MDNKHVLIKTSILSGADSVIPNIKQLVSYAVTRYLSGDKIIKKQIHDLQSGAIKLNADQEKRYQALIEEEKKLSILKRLQSYLHTYEK